DAVARVLERFGHPLEQLVHAPPPSRPLPPTSPPPAKLQSAACPPHPARRAATGAGDRSRSSTAPLDLHEQHRNIDDPWPPPKSPSAAPANITSRASTSICRATV